MKKLTLLLLSVATLALTGCHSKPKEPYDYTEFKKSNPKSILLVMPTNDSLDVKAPTSVLAQASIPLAEKGYYVFPVTLVDEVFKQNGLPDGNSIRSASIKKIQEIFGADAIMYLNVKEYGTEYKVIDSITSVVVAGKLVDLRTGKILWEGEQVTREGSGSGNNGILVQLVVSAINQITNTMKDRGYDVAKTATSHLFHLGTNGGILNGPRLLLQPKK
ncbi:hypothetical protein EV693_101113 [Nicoletella semolina]|uniref:Lipoprotein n=1 Tax=Nicoletella semolina TaxID=271160 RepID=A0A4R2NCH9_9PAST|nr:DUF799 domain-containing protein [Nicoletella semolina]MDH2924256.1 hypothetical protein [Nicoletella semolina]TCP18847.1 hypothetical protein EV693_101113 [Nicoletella semolina]